MRKLCLYGTFILSLLCFNAHSQQAEIIEGTLYIKLKSGANVRSGNNLQLTNIPGLETYQPVLKSTNNRRQKPSILDGLYQVQVAHDVDIGDLCKELEKYGNVVYAEPIFKEQLLAVPNDPAIADGSVGYLDVIKAYAAWDLTTGDSSMVIGISDTGINMDHVDLTNKIYRNVNDIPNGIDDDNNGYIDDYKGYDFADDDSIATADNNFHGSRVAGIAGAETNNGIGIAGVGYKSQISSLKIFRSADNLASGAYNSIVYAADNGYDVINLSWGSPNSHSQAAQDIINYAVEEKNLIITGAAGNTPEKLDFYPASYDNVLSVAATNLDDSKASFSSFSYKVDISAPGNAIYSTDKDSTFRADNGTSYSAPMAAGTAALIKTLHPSLNARQVIERIRVTSDPIYQTGSNTNYQDQLGFGRLNMQRALEARQDTLKSIRIESFSYSNGISDKVYYGDSIELQLKLINYLGPSQAQISISSPSENALFDESFVYQLPNMQELDTVSITFKALKIANNTPPESSIPIRIGFTDGNYQDFEYLELETENDRVDIQNNQLEFTIGGNGNLGYTDDLFSNGLGLKWKEQNTLSRMSFMVAIDSNQVSNNFYSEVLGNSRNQDFIAKQFAKRKHLSAVDFFAISTFSDDEASTPANLQIEQRTITNTASNYLIQEYFIGNTSTTDYSISAGLYTDWNLSFARQNRSYYNESLGAIISFSSDSSIFTGITCYYDTQPIHQSFDQGDWNNNASDISGSWSENSLFLHATSSQFDSAGWVEAGNDISTLLSNDSISIAAGGSQKTAYIIAFGDTMESLLVALDSGKSAYESYLQQPLILEEFITCEGTSLDIDLANGVNFDYYSDALGTNMIGSGDTLTTGNINQDTAFYARNTDGTYKGDIYEIRVRTSSPETNFSMSTDTLFLNSDLNKVSFIDESLSPIAWHWDFGNGIQSTVRNPTVSFSEEGNYEIMLTVENELGCFESLTQELLVATRPPSPEISNKTICNGEVIVIVAENTDSLAFYINHDDIQPISTGKEFTFSGLDTDTIFYFTNTSGPFESLKKPITINVEQYKADFKLVPDTSSAQTFAVLIDLSEENSTSRWSIDSEEIGTGDSLRIPITGSTFSVSLTSTSATGCSDTITKSVELSPSDTPEVQEQVYCYGEDITLSPSNGSLFGFYLDAELNELIDKNSYTVIHSLTAPSTIYIVGLDSILPSEPIELLLTPQRPTVDITANPDTLYLDQKSTVVFNAEGETFNSTQWYFDDAYYDNSQEPIVYINEEGTYRMHVEVTDMDGCQNSDTINYLVFDETPKPPLSATDHHPVIYPNPAPVAGLVIIKIPPTGQNSLINLYNLAGKLVLTRHIAKGNSLTSIEGLSAGVYLIKITSGSFEYIEKIIIK